MSRNRCSQCLQVVGHCLCHVIRPVANPVSVFVVQDPQETRHALGTVKIARLGLERFTRLPVTPGEVAPGRQLLSAVLPDNATLVYPGNESLRIMAPSSGANGDVSSEEPFAKAGDVSLVFIDATWRRSKRILYEQPLLDQLPRYQLVQVSPPRYTLRKSPGVEALSTLEAIVEMLVCLDPARYDDYRRLLAAMDLMVDHQLRAMGAATYMKNYG